MGGAREWGGGLHLGVELTVSLREVPKAVAEVGGGGNGQVRGAADPAEQMEWRGWSLTLGGSSSNHKLQPFLLLHRPLALQEGK